MSSDAVKDFVAGTFGGMALVVTGHPFDTLKVRLQTAPPGHFSSFTDCVKQTFAKEGAKGFYKGVGSPLVGVSAINSVLFFTWGRAQRLLQPDKNVPLTTYELICAGALTGLAVAFAEGPVDLVKSKMQVQYGTGGQYKNSFDCARQLVINYGIRGLYQGILPTILRNVPANAAYFAGYEFMRRLFTGDAGGSGERKLPAWAVLTAGAIGGIGYWVSCFPFDVIKSRIQTEPSDMAQRQYKSTWDAAVKLNKAEGWRGFWRGFTPCMLRACPANAACFFAYETARSLLG